MTRNASVYETVLVKAATDALLSRLPVGWDLKLTSGGPDDDRRSPSRILTVTVAERGRAAFAVRVDGAARRAATDLADQLRTTQSTCGETPLLFITEYANPPLRRALEDASISYLDTTGWACLTSSTPVVLIRTDGASKPPRPRQHTATARLNGPAAARAIRELLVAQPPLGIRELATKSSSSPAAVSKLMPTLIDAGAVERSPNGAITLIRRRTLLDRWIADYSFMHSNGIALDYIAPRGVTRTLERIRGRDDVVVSGSAAAREYLPAETTSVVPLGSLALYTADVTGLASSLELIRADRAASNVIITTPGDRTLLDSAPSSATGFRVAPVGQVLADLLTLPRGRLAQEAEQLIETLARTDAAWRE